MNMIISLPENTWELVKHISEYVNMTPHDYIVNVVTSHAVTFDNDMEKYLDDLNTNYDD